MCTHVPIKIRVKICCLCFGILIFLDCIAALNSVEGLLEILFESNEGKTETRADLQGQKDTPKGNVVETDLTKTNSNEDKTVAILHVLMEMCVFCILLSLNTSALLGVKREKAYLLVPWLSVYLLGIFR